MLHSVSIDKLADEMNTDKTDLRAKKRRFLLGSFCNILSYVIESKVPINFVLLSDNVISAFIVSERWYCKNSLLYTYKNILKNIKYE